MYNYVQHKFENGFPLSNCLLYYLGWYYRSDDIWGDIRKCIIEDGYAANHMTKREIFRFIISIVDDWNLYAANNGYKLIPLSKMLVSDWDVDRWREYDSEEPRILATIWSIFSELTLGYDNQEVKYKKPHFSKEKALKPCDYLKGGTYTSANRRVEKYEWV